MWHKPHTYLKTASFILGISILSACTKQKDDDPNYPNLMPNAEAIIVDIPAGGMFYIDADYTFVNNPYATTDYIINGPVYIAAGHTIVEPGTRIKFTGAESGIYVTGTGGFTGYGTAEQPVYFEGVDTYPGSWRGIFFGTENPVNKLEYCVVKHAGGGKAEFMDEAAAVGITKNAEELQNNCAWISNTIVHQSAGYGIYVSGLKGYFLNFYENTVSNSALAPLGIPFRLAPSVAINNNLNPDSAENTLQYIFLYNDGFNQSVDFNQAGTFENHGIPYRIRGTEGVTLIGAPLTVAAGTTFEFGFDGGFAMKGSGSLRAVGSSQAPITFKGIQGGNGHWVGLAFYTNSAENLLVNCVITGGGSKKSPWSDGQANIVLGNFLGDAGSVSVSNSQIGHSQGWAIAKNQASTLTQSANQFIDNKNQPDVYTYP